MPLDPTQRVRDSSIDTAASNNRVSLDPIRPVRDTSSGFAALKNQNPLEPSHLSSESLRQNRRQCRLQRNRDETSFGLNLTPNKEIGTGHQISQVTTPSAAARGGIYSMKRSCLVFK
jgi:hypothetical protein